MDIEKFDISSIYPELYKADRLKPNLVKVPVVRIMAISGEGDPGGPRFQDSVAALYSIAYTIRFMPRKGIRPEGYVDFKIAALEALWSMKNGRVFNTIEKDQWLWEVFLVVPGFITQKTIKQAIGTIAEQKPNQRYDDIHISTLQEKKAAQIMHIGSYDKESASLEVLHKYIKKCGYKPAARHHEIYLSDPNRTPKNKLKTILRQPIVKI